MKKKTANRHFSLRRAAAMILALLLTVCLFSGCGDKDTSQGGDGQKPVKLVIFAPTLIIKDDEARQKEYKQLMKDATGYDVEFITTPISGFEEKLGVMLSSGQQIDLIWTTGVPSIVKMVNQGFLTPIDDYVAGSEFFNSDGYLGREGIESTTIEKHVYGVPYKMPMGYVPIINKTWLDQLGLPVPTSFEELNDALYAFVENDLGGGLTIGTTHQYPYEEQIANWLGFFGVEGGHVTRNAEGKRYHPFLTENGKQGLLWLQQLYADGILDVEFPTVQETSMRQKMTNGNVGMTFDWPASSEETNRKAANNGKDVNMVVMEPVSAVEGVTPVIPGHTLVSWVISSTSKHPDAAFKLIEYLVSDKAVGELGMKEGLDYEFDETGHEVLLENAAGLIVQQSALSPIKDLQSGIHSTETAWHEMEILNKYILILPWERENSESDIIASRNLLKCITGLMSVDDYLTSMRDELMKFNMIDISDY